MTRRAYFLATFGIVYTGAAAIVNVMVAALLAHLVFSPADPRNGCLFLGVAGLLVVVSIVLGVRLLDRLEREWDRSEAEGKR